MHRIALNCGLDWSAASCEDPPNRLALCTPIIYIAVKEDAFPLGLAYPQRQQNAAPEALGRRVVCSKSLVCGVAQNLVSKRDAWRWVGVTMRPVQPMSLSETALIATGALIVTTRTLPTAALAAKASCARGSLWLCGLLMAISNGCYRENVPMMQVIQGRTMGTTYSIKFTADHAAPVLLSVSKQVEAELKSINECMSTYIASSEISRFNRSSSTDWFPVSADTAQVVSLAQEISSATGGAFDVTVGRLVELWGFGPANRLTTPPTEEQVEQLLRSVGYQRLHVRLDPPALQKDAPELSVDLSAIAKGFAVDQVAEVLRAASIEDFFIEIGGEVLTRGKRLDGRDWQVGIELPDPRRRALYGSVELSGAAMATSGNYRNFYEIAGERFSHMIDPKTGRPSRQGLTSATVVDDSCAKADAIATGLMVLGYEEGLRVSNKMGWKVFLIRHEETNANSDASGGAGLSTGASAAFEAEFTVKAVN